MKPRYRIVNDDWNGFECQVKYWWSPFWVEIETNTHLTVEAAEAFIRDYAKVKRVKITRFVKEVKI